MHREEVTFNMRSLTFTLCFIAWSSIRRRDYQEESATFGWPMSRPQHQSYSLDSHSRGDWRDANFEKIGFHLVRCRTKAGWKAVAMTTKGGRVLKCCCWDCIDLCLLLTKARKGGKGMNNFSEIFIFRWSLLEWYNRQCATLSNLSSWRKFCDHLVINSVRLTSAVSVLSVRLQASFWYIDCVGWVGNTTIFNTPLRYFVSKTLLFFSTLTTGKRHFRFLMMELFSVGRTR